MRASTTHGNRLPFSRDAAYRTAVVSVILSFALTTSVVAANDAPLLQGTLWESVGRGHRIDPYLLYSVALVESRRHRTSDLVSPWPWTLNSPGGPRYFDSRREAENALATMLSSHPDLSVDIGLMQINTLYHGHRVDDLQQLLDPETNLRIGTAILREAMTSAPDRPRLGVGRYHSWTPDRAREYGARVWDIYERIRPATRYALYFQDTFDKESQ
ncbi:MAG: lytic transglycosylase domain-containing protein [Pseudomonadota bacterium]|nr:lytic transglycosylase domain-containing protein [Pseudomonadota bacterium]